MTPLLEFREVSKVYYMGDSEIWAANKISMTIQRGEFVAIVGQSGSGKSTCMNIIGCLDVPTEGQFLLDGQDVGRMNKNQLADIRNKKLGFIFQQYNLLPKLNLMENVEVPLMYAGLSKSQRRKQSIALLTRVGLGEKLKHRPSQLSGGQQQRVSIARALAGNPAIILADEPTGALDSRTGKEVLALLQELHQQGNTVVLITHDNTIAAQADRIIRLEDGYVVYDGPANLGATMHGQEKGNQAPFETQPEPLQETAPEAPPEINSETQPEPSFAPEVQSSQEEALSELQREIQAEIQPQEEEISPPESLAKSRYIHPPKGKKKGKRLFTPPNLNTPPEEAWEKRGEPLPPSSKKGVES